MLVLAGGLPRVAGLVLVSLCVGAVLLLSAKAYTPRTRSSRQIVHALRLGDYEEDYLDSDGSLPFLLFRKGLAPKLNRIPKIVHFTILPPREYGFVQYFALATAFKLIRPDRILLHTPVNFKPSGIWWDRALATERVEVHTVEAPSTIFGNKIGHAPHQSDVLRLQVLLEFGGIYLDSDAFVTRSLDDLLHEDFVIGIEQTLPIDLPAHEVTVKGCGNNVMLASRNSTFLRHWYDQYRYFDTTDWSYHSISLPWKIAKQANKLDLDVTVLDHRGFHPLLYDDQTLLWAHGTLPDPAANETLDELEDRMHGAKARDQPGWSFALSRQYVSHISFHALGRSKDATRGDLNGTDQLGPEDIRARTSSFNRFARTIVADLL